MMVHIFKMLPSPMGKIPGDEILATVELTASGGVKIESYDVSLKEKLKDVFSMPLIKRIPTEKETGVLSHYDEAIQPFTEEHVEEAVYTLHKQGLFGQIIPG